MIDIELISFCKSVKRSITQKGKINICTDSRKYNHPSMFVAIPGAKVNPLDVISGLLELECPIVFYSQDEANDKIIKNFLQIYPKTEFIPVTDSVTFLQELAHLHIKQWKEKNPKNTIFAISGSNGKTTHKEILSSILSEVMPGKVVATEKNNNNHLGVPLTLLAVNDKTEMVVLELGSNHPGEIKVLCDIAVPTAGLTTNIGATHLEFFGDEEKVYLEEGYLYHSIKETTQGNGFYLINTDDYFLKRLPPTLGSITYGENPGAMAKVSFLENGAEIHFKGQNFVATNDFITGKHNKLNLVTCLFIACSFYPEKKLNFVEACKNFRPTKNRSEWIKFESRSVFLDAYNANPSSMKAALEGFKESVIDKGLALTETCVVLGDMNELGDSTAEYHKEVGAFVRNLGFPNVYFVGRFSSFYLNGNPLGHAKASSMDFKQEYREQCLKKYSIHFIKGSRSLQLESLFDIT